MVQQLVEFDATQAARHCGDLHRVSFLRLVRNGLAPEPIRRGGRSVWHRNQLEPFRRAGYIGRPQIADPDRAEVGSCLEVTTGIIEAAPGEFPDVLVALCMKLAEIMRDGRVPLNVRAEVSRECFEQQWPTLLQGAGKRDMKELKLRRERLRLIGLHKTILGGAV